MNSIVHTFHVSRKYTVCNHMFVAHVHIFLSQYDNALHTQLIVNWFGLVVWDSRGTPQ